MLSANVTERRLQLAGIIVMSGLLVVGFSLMGRGPVAFLICIALGGSLLAAGIVAYLLALVRLGSRISNP